MSEPFLGEIRPFAFTFVPRGWASCAGQLLSIAQNSALFSILGTTYGGDGRTTFALPDLRDRVPIAAGSGPGLTPRSPGEAGGSASVTLTVAQLPAHTHTPVAQSQPGTTGSAVDDVWARDAGGGKLYSVQGGAQMAADALAASGSGAAHDNLQPGLAIQFCIAIEGIYPSHG
ncbi:phage tail protein [Plasticicumulans sp.]|uniref:phage tail protein n=2 Tax=Plasticicumulans sp. TaxID=2307179 RepID=UPI000F949478|nr:tail fiber protein [Plasticicumulans sp.]MBS0603391.1 phage tail protein [Pseudomonadota bacterium]RTL03287.1 MAG: phage tail protein [Xanthomonadales bacterium]HMW29792.1 tail fiber protein [Plasticicumulans sp.]HMX54660.1 tail fiber protein [Plasticicumulans sp.]HMZ12320.1 tail fiber protein [Plasticicumulans sp.]